MPAKFKIVVSDLHLSAGHVAEGNPLEDFESDQEFAAFLEQFAAESNRDGAEVELIVNGDAFEMLQVPHVDQFEPDKVYPPRQYHSSSEPDSALRKAARTILARAEPPEVTSPAAASAPPERSSSTSFPDSAGGATVDSLSTAAR